MQSIIIVKCDTCGDELNVTDISASLSNEIIMKIQPCNTKDCGRRDDCITECEDVLDLQEQVRELNIKLNTKRNRNE